jgi:hypothetical protein
LPGQRTDIPELVQLLLDSGKVVAAYEHQSAWIDINDAQLVKEAERLVARHLSDFECWHPSPDKSAIHLAITQDHQVLGIARQVHDVPTEWDLPQGAVDGQMETAAERMCCAVGLASAAPRLLGAYDDFDEEGGTVTRRYLFECVAAQAALANNTERRWIPLESSTEGAQLSPVMRRTIGLLRNMP